jgi:Ca-activated chloride channel family protein
VGKHAPRRSSSWRSIPKEGTLFSDNPYVVLRAPWVGDDVRAGAEDFLAFLREPAAQKRFTDAGFRSFDNKPGTAVSTSPELLADGVKITLNPPPPAVLAGVRGAWEQVRKRARVLLLLDVSGSMEEPAGGGKSKLELAKAAALDALQDFAPTDQVGVWAFTTELPTPTRITVELAPVAPLGSQRDRVTAAVRDLIPLNGTPLYAATRRAAETMTASADASRINAVVVLTDGRNEYPADTDLAGLKDTLSAGSRESGGPGLHHRLRRGRRPRRATRDL